MLWLGGRRAPTRASLTTLPETQPALAPAMVVECPQPQAPTAALLSQTQRIDAFKRLVASPLLAPDPDSPPPVRVVDCRLGDGASETKAILFANGNPWQWDAVGRSASSGR